MIILIVIGAFSTVTKRLLKRLEELVNKRTSVDHPSYYIIEIGQNTEKSPGDLRRFAITQNFSERPSAKADVTNSQGVNYDNKISQERLIMRQLIAVEILGLTEQ